MPIKYLCKVYDLPESSYYYHKGQEKSKNREGLLSLKKEIRRIYELRNGCYGYRRITMELNKTKGVHYNPKKIHRLCKELGLQSTIRRKKHKKYEPGQISENLLAQNFYSEKPCKKLVTDITETRVDNVKYYICAVLDLFNREILGYSIGKSANTELVTKALSESLSKNKRIKKIIVHSDQGKQFTSFIFKKLITDNGHLPSNSRKGNCLDNAVMENFFGHFKSELIYNKKITSEEMFYEDVKNYMFFYNNVRIQNKTKMSPVEVRQNFYKLKKVSNLLGA